VETLKTCSNAHNQYEKDLKRQLQRVNDEDEREVMQVDLEELQEERGDLQVVIDKLKKHSDDAQRKGFPLNQHIVVYDS
jgi:hypothetical protein